MEEEIKLSLTKDGKTYTQTIPASKRDAYFKIAESKGIEVQEMPWTVKEQDLKQKNHLKKLKQEVSELEEIWLNPGFFTSGKQKEKNLKAYETKQKEYVKFQNEYKTFS